ncbi:MAG: DHH family phosphoesterase, partial [Oscillospiraceae bacterium]|nr:DHH family phosphoesterase [Oscillospiraceae bacterium]
IALTAAMFFVNRNLFYVVLGMTVFIILLFSVRVVQIRNGLSSLITGVGTGMSSTQQAVLADISTPVVVTDESGSVLWYNDSFRLSFLKNKDVYLEDIKSIIPSFDLAAFEEKGGSSCEEGERHFRVFSTRSQRENDAVLYVTLFVEDSQVFREALGFRRTRPSVLMLTVDSYDELASEVKESSRAELMSEVYRAMEDFINTTNGVFFRLNERSYAAIIEEQHMEKIIAQRFPVLDAVRAIDGGHVPITVSLGVGRGAKTLYENYIQARHALDMALGRGGDQAAMKTRNGYEFYGGQNRAVEKRNKVKSRIIAMALLDLMRAAENTVVMGHKLSDLDALGAAVGVARMARAAKAKVSIVLDSRATMARMLYDRLLSDGDGELFVEPGGAEGLVTEKTLLVIVDCHVPQLLENAALLRETKNIVIIDHHRKMVGYIENPVLSYHEPYASSCCELVAELLQQIEAELPEEKLTKTEAEGMLSGIMLDSHDFSVRTGVRTYEAASYLRRLGASPAQAKMLFATDLQTYKSRTELVSKAELYRGCALVVSDNLPENMRVVIPQAADDLLGIDGVSASIVAVRFQDKIHISARSLGAFNVQLIMEHLGGGGHQTMAGVQLEDAELSSVRQSVQEAIDNYLDNNPPLQGEKI